MAFQAVIFDLGGVLTKSPVTVIQDAAIALGIPIEVLGDAMSHHVGLWPSYERGEIDDTTFVRELEAAVLLAGHTLDGHVFLRDHFFANVEPRPEMIAVAKALRPRYKVAAITNNVGYEGRGQPNTDYYIPFFDHLVESWRVGTRKPDAPIFHHTCALLGVTPEECVFLDDFGSNLKAAKALGFTTIKVDATLSAVEELERVLGHALQRHSAVRRH